MTVLALSQVGDLQETAGSSAGLWEVKWLKLMRKGGDVKDLLGYVPDFHSSFFRRELRFSSFWNRKQAPWTGLGKFSRLPVRQPKLVMKS